jgi:hypothetical protein
MSINDFTTQARYMTDQERESLQEFYKLVLNKLDKGYVSSKSRVGDRRR